VIYRIPASSFHVLKSQDNCLRQSQWNQHSQPLKAEDDTPELPPPHCLVVKLMPTAVSGKLCASGESCHEVRFQEFLNSLWRSQNKPHEMLNVKDSEVISCIHHHSHIMIPGLLSSQLAQRFVGKLLS